MKKKKSDIKTQANKQNLCDTHKKQSSMFFSTLIPILLKSHLFTKLLFFSSKTTEDLLWITLWSPWISKGHLLHGDKGENGAFKNAEVWLLQMWWGAREVQSQSISPSPPTLGDLSVKMPLWPVTSYSCWGKHVVHAHRISEVWDHKCSAQILI